MSARSTARNLTVDLANAARSPSSTFAIRTQNRDFSTEPLTDDEAGLFETQFNTLINDFDSQLLSQLFQERSQDIADVAALSKNLFDEKMFGGINADDNEVGFDVLRPGHIRADPSSGSAENDWYFEPGSTGWNDWIGDGSSNNYTVSEDQVILVLGFMDQDKSTEVSGFNVQEFGRNVNMIPKDLNDARTFDNKNELMIQSLPAMVGTELDDVHIRLRHDRVSESQPRLLGITFGVGSYMNTEDY